jgi:hypothetical protein
MYKSFLKTELLLLLLHKEAAQTLSGRSRHWQICSSLSKNSASQDLTPCLAHWKKYWHYFFPVALQHFLPDHNQV